MVQHLEPHQPSLLADLLTRQTVMPVTAAVDGKTLEADHVYVIAPGTLLTLEESPLRLSATAQPAVQAAIDVFFRSLAERCRERAVGILLSGAGHDKFTPPYPLMIRSGYLRQATSGFKSVLSTSRQRDSLAVLLDRRHRACSAPAA